MNCIHFCGNVTLELTFNWFPPGVLMFISGMAINIHSDYILRNLRKPGEVSYKIPTGQCIQYLILNFEGHSWKSHSEKQKINYIPYVKCLFSGGMFELISGANFFGEIIEWCGFAVATWSFPAFSFAFFTICSIGPRAYHHHRCSTNF